jgi:hypothetical protein
MVTREAQRLRRPRGVGAAHPRFALLMIVPAIGLLGIGTGPALAQGSGPEKPPVKAPAKLGPEPAPVAGGSASAASSSGSSASQASPSTTSRPAVVVTQTRTAVHAQPRSIVVPTPKPPPPTPAKPRAKKAVESVAHGIQASATRIAALGAAPGDSSNSNHLLFLGGLALLVLVLGDAAFLAVSARVLRESPDR